MSRPVLLPLFLLATLSGCTSLHLPGVRGDLYETQVRAGQALDGDAAAYARLETLQADWARRGHQGFLYKVSPWDRGNRERAAQIAAAAERIVAGRDAILSQRDLTEVMVNALKDLESEYDAISAMREESGEQGAGVAVAAGQKYLARRMMNSIVVMSQSDMSAAVEAADTFGRDVARFQQVLDAEINGNEELGIEPSSNPEVEDSLSQIEELFTGYVADSAGDVLENVVARYDAWSALREIRELGDAVLVTAPPVSPGAADAGAPAAAAVDGEVAADVGTDDAGADEPAADDAGADDAGQDDHSADSATDEPADVGAGDEQGDESLEDDAEAGDDAY